MTASNINHLKWPLSSKHSSLLHDDYTNSSHPSNNTTALIDQSNALHKTQDTLYEYDSKLSISFVNDNPFSDDHDNDSKFLKNEVLSPMISLLKEDNNEHRTHDHTNLLSIDSIYTMPKSKDYTCHVLFIVHGIGARPEILKKNLEKIRNTIDNIRKVKKDYFQCPVHIKMIDWKSTLCSNVKELIERVTLQSNKKQRNIVNEVPTDLLFYLNPEHSKDILDQVVLQANHTYFKLKEQFQQIKVSFIGHSLGSVILYDLFTKRFKHDNSNSIAAHITKDYGGNDPNISNNNNITNRYDHKNHHHGRSLSQQMNNANVSNDTQQKSQFHYQHYQQQQQQQQSHQYYHYQSSQQGSSSMNNIMFNFQIENIFFIGSPLGMFISLNKSKLILPDQAKFSKGFYNIFHPNDLLAYRLEPLLQYYTETPPYEIPYIKNDGLKKHKEKLIDKEASVSGLGGGGRSGSAGLKILSFTDTKNIMNSNMIKEFKRYDYALQEGYFENMIESLGMINGHWVYWDSQDLFYFILKKIHSNIY